MLPDDETLLLDMLIAARRASKYAEGVSRGDFEADLLLQDGVVHQIQIVGEAAGRVTEELKDAHPEIPWRRVIGMRHWLVHGYRNLDLDRVWDTAQNWLPPLIAALQPLVPPDEDA